MHDLDPHAVNEIRAKLEAVKASGVHIGFAIESGSRAWGFPSPDSDYDCRFIYMRPPAAYLSLFPPRDVIEFPIVGDIDIGGWDLRKALLLALKGNAVVVEWSTSPIVYEEDAGFLGRLKIVLEEIIVPSKVAFHYAGLFKQHFHGDGETVVKLKKLLYSIRPAIALEWMSERDFKVLPPMNMLECLEGCRISGEQRRAVLDLIELKKVTKEMGTGPVPAPIQTLLTESMHRFGALGKCLERDSAFDESAKRRADAFFLSEIERCSFTAWPSGNQTTPGGLD